MLELKHIHKYYNPGTVNEMCLFEDFNLTVEIFSPGGSSTSRDRKSTRLNSSHRL